MKVIFLFFFIFLSILIKGQQVESVYLNGNTNISIKPNKTFELYTNYDLGFEEDIDGGLNTLANGGNVGEAMKTGTISGGISAATAAILGGISAGANAMENGGNCFTGKGTTFANELVIGEGTLGGDYFNDDISMQSNIESKNGWKPGKYGISDITVEGTPPDVFKDRLYYRNKGVLNRCKTFGPDIIHEIGGVTVQTQNRIFNKPQSVIYMSPHFNIAEFTSTLNHEFIHAYHHSLNLYSLYNSSFTNATEYSAYSYQFQNAPSAISRNNALWGMNKFGSPFRLKWPSFLIPIF